MANARTPATAASKRTVTGVRVAKRVAPQRKTGVRELSAQATRESILKAATRVFAKYGFEGGSVEKISKAAKSVDRMLYYYFGNKEGLFIEVIEDIYRRMNEAESQLDLNTDEPVQALKDVIAFVLNYYRRNPEFVTLLNTENLHLGRHITKSDRAAQYSSPAIDVIRRILETGVRKKLFRQDLVARDVYLLIVSTGYFFMSNRYTLSAFMGEDLQTPEAVQQWQDFVTDTVLRTVKR
jgi:AcrR family transcriptional regulator